jgi:D-3-phosphoglycerate dehydrogenase
VKGTGTKRYVSMISVGGSNHSVSGTITGHDSEMRVVSIDGVEVDVPPSQNMIVVRNDDRPGMVGAVGSGLAEASVNIADMALGRTADRSTAIMVIATDQEVSQDIRAQIASVPGIIAVDILSR